MSNELLPCPFCGGEAELFPATQQVDDSIDISQNPEMMPIWIGVCAAQCIVYVNSEAEAIAAWNRRTTPPLTGDVGELVAEARLALDRNFDYNQIAQLAARLCDALEAAHSGTLEGTTLGNLIGDIERGHGSHGEQGHPVDCWLCDAVHKATTSVALEAHSAPVRGTEQHTLTDSKDCPVCNAAHWREVE